MSVMTLDTHAVIEAGAVDPAIMDVVRSRNEACIKLWARLCRHRVMTHAAFQSNDGTLRAASSVIVLKEIAFQQRCIMRTQIALRAAMTTWIVTSVLAYTGRNLMEAADITPAVKTECAKLVDFVVHISTRRAAVRSFKQIFALVRTRVQALSRACAADMDSIEAQVLRRGLDVVREQWIDVAERSVEHADRTRVTATAMSIYRQGAETCAAVDALLHQSKCDPDKYYMPAAVLVDLLHNIEAAVFSVAQCDMGEHNMLRKDSCGDIDQVGALSMMVPTMICRCMAQFGLVSPLLCMPYLPNQLDQTQAFNLFMNHVTHAHTSPGTTPRIGCVVAPGAGLEQALHAVSARPAIFVVSAISFTAAVATYSRAMVATCMETVPAMPAARDIASDLVHTSMQMAAYFYARFVEWLHPHLGDNHVIHCASTPSATLMVGTTSAAAQIIVPTDWACCECGYQLPYTDRMRFAPVMLRHNCGSSLALCFGCAVAMTHTAHSNISIEIPALDYITCVAGRAMCTARVSDHGIVLKCRNDAPDNSVFPLPNSLRMLETPVVPKAVMSVMECALGFIAATATATAQTIPSLRDRGVVVDDDSHMQQQHADRMDDHIVLRSYDPVWDLELITTSSFTNLVITALFAGSKGVARAVINNNTTASGVVTSQGGEENDNDNDNDSYDEDAISAILLSSTPAPAPASATRETPQRKMIINNHGFDFGAGMVLGNMSVGVIGTDGACAVHIVSPRAGAAATWRHANSCAETTSTDVMPANYLLHLARIMGVPDDAIHSTPLEVVHHMHAMALTDIAAPLDARVVMLVCTHPALQERNSMATAIAGAVGFTAHLARTVAEKRRRQGLAATGSAPLPFIRGSVVILSEQTRAALSPRTPYLPTGPVTMRLVHAYGMAALSATIPITAINATPTLTCAMALRISDDHSHQVVAYSFESITHKFVECMNEFIDHTRCAVINQHLAVSMTETALAKHTDGVAVCTIQTLCNAIAANGGAAAGAVHMMDGAGGVYTTREQVARCALMSRQKIMVADPIEVCGMPSDAVVRQCASAAKTISAAAAANANRRSALRRTVTRR